MNCRICGDLPECSAHGVAFISEVELDKEFDDYCYTCDYCIQECGSGAFGCIRHWCSDMMGAFSGKSQDAIDRGIEDAIKELEA